MAKITETRLTLAAFIYGIEIDLKNIIKKYVAPFYSELSFLGNKDLESKIIDRFKKENPGIDITNNIEDSIDFLDFQDTFVTIIKNDVFIPKSIIDELNSIKSQLFDITPIRNRVMHTRPLLGGDFSTVYEFIKDLKNSSAIGWQNTIQYRDLVEKDSSYLLSLKIPNLQIEEENSSVIHNLPLPEFDDTGFIGRNKDIDDIKKLIFSNKVVSILGDGGIGKTALALKIAYDLVDMDEKCPFELIIWTSAKTTMLTSKGIEEIYTAITDYTGLVNEIAVQLDSNTRENKLESILEYLDLFKTLIIIDNLETIQSVEVRDFIRLAQTKCNIVITSRIGLGELEYPRNLSGMTENECSKLIREIARIRNSDILLGLPQNTLAEISSKLYYNPLALKWFVSTVEMGISPNEVLNNKEDLLNFCLTNVYEKLSQGAIDILNTVRASRRKISTAEILYLSDYETINARKYLIELFKTTLINREIVDKSNLEEVYFYIPEFAKEFLSHKYPVNIEFVKKITKKSKELTSGVQDIIKVNDYNEFSLNALSCDSPSQKIAAKILSEALAFSKKNDYKSAFRKVNEAKSVDPNYYEVYRIGGFLKAQNGDTLGAEEDYITGLEIAPDNPRLLYYYTQFLLFYLEDIDNALINAEKVFKLKPDSPYSTFLYVRCFNVLKDFNYAIQLIKNLIAKGSLNPLTLRMAYTELISLYANSAQSFFKVQIDITNGISHFKKSFSTFQECVKMNIVDPKMLKNFCEALINFISFLPTTEIQNNHSFIKEIIKATENHISSFYLCKKLILKFNEKFDDSTLNYLINEDSNSINNKLGNLIKTNYDTYAFIESDNDRYFAHYTDFQNVSSPNDLKKIPNGQLVSFDEGTNSKGVCATNVKIISS